MDKILKLNASMLGDFFDNPCDRFLYKMCESDSDNNKSAKSTKVKCSNIFVIEKGSNDSEENEEEPVEAETVEEEAKTVEEAGKKWEGIVGESIKKEYNHHVFSNDEILTGDEDREKYKDKLPCFLLQARFIAEDLPYDNIKWGTMIPDLIYVYEKGGKIHYTVGDIKLKTTIAWQFKMQIAAYIRVLKKLYENNNKVVIDDDRAFVICAENEVYNEAVNKVIVDEEKLILLKDKLSYVYESKTEEDVLVKHEDLFFDPTAWLEFLDDFINVRIERISKKGDADKQDRIFDTSCEDCPYFSYKDANEKDTDCEKWAEVNEPVKLLPYITARAQRYAIDNKVKFNSKVLEKAFTVKNYFDDVFQGKISGNSWWKEFQFHYEEDLGALKYKLPTKEPGQTEESDQTEEAGQTEEPDQTEETGQTEASSQTDELAQKGINK